MVCVRRVVHGRSRNRWAYAVSQKTSNERSSRSLSSGDASVIDAEVFAQKQLELTGEFGKYVIDHPEVDDLLPPESYIYFQIDGDEDLIATAESC